VRQYSRDRLFEAGEGAEVRRRHGDWAVALAERAGPELFGPGQSEWLDRLEGEHDNLRAALEWSAESGAVEAGLRIGAAIWRFWHIRGYLREGRERLERLLARPEAAAGTSVRARALDAAGVLASTTGDQAAGRAHYEEMLAIGEALHEGRISAAALNGLGEAAYFETGSRPAAHPFHERSLVVAREANDRWNAAFALLCLGRFKESLALFRALGDQRSICFVLFNMGDRARDEGDYPRARSLFEESLAIRRKLNDREAMSLELGRLVSLALDHGDFAAARAHSEEALLVSRGAHDKRGIAWALGELGVVAYLQGNLETARSLYEESLAAYRELEEKLGIAAALNLLGQVTRQQGDLEAARSLHEEVLVLRPELKGGWAMQPIADALLNLGIIAQRQGDCGQALARYRESMAEYQELQEGGGMASGLEALAGLAAAEGEPERAARLFGAAAARREALGSPIPPVDRAEYQRRVADVRAALGEEAFTAAWAEGQVLPIEPAIALALGEGRNG
jgi:tetratricopeptide (TPR) repeat protein